jgi:ABC-type phosphate/phosphonate transport system substrate-binding protein
MSLTVRPTVSSFFKSHTIEVISEDGCSQVVHTWNPLMHKKNYRVGVYSNEGDEAAFRLYNKTFATYLTATAGQHFNPPISFEIVPVNLNSLMIKAESEQVDFFYGTPAVFSCMATEYKAQSLVTIINKREARGHEFELDMYGGVMFTLASNTQVNSIEDFRDKTIGAGGITMMGGGQLQFYEMFSHGVSYVAHPKQVVFTGDERKTVQGVLDGDFEIGFARTDQIERHKDENGEDINPGRCLLPFPRPTWTNRIQYCVTLDALL